MSDLNECKNSVSEGATPEKRERSERVTIEDIPEECEKVKDTKEARQPTFPLFTTKETNNAKEMREIANAKNVNRYKNFVSSALGSIRAAAEQGKLSLTLKVKQEDVPHPVLSDSLKGYGYDVTVLKSPNSRDMSDVALFLYLATNTLPELETYTIVIKW